MSSEINADLKKLLTASNGESIAEILLTIANELKKYNKNNNNNTQNNNLFNLMSGMGMQQNEDDDDDDDEDEDEEDEEDENGVVVEEVDDEIPVLE